MTAIMLRILIPAGFLLVIDLYFFQVLRSVNQDVSANISTALNLGYWGLNILVYAALAASILGYSFPNYIRYYLFSSFLILFLPKIVGIIFLLGEDLFRIGAYGVSLLGDMQESSVSGRRKFISQLAIATAAIPFTAMIYGMMRTAYDLNVRKTTIHFQDLPKSFDGLKIVQISDIHSGSFRSVEPIQHAVERILSLQPDLVFFTGDLVNNRADEAEPYVNEFKKLTAKHGVYSILGNHDYGDYGPWNSNEEKAENFERLKNVHHNAGWNLLLNGSKVLEADGESLAIVGVENWGASRHFPKYGDLDKAVEGAENVPFKILLSHDPSHWDSQIKSHSQKFQLTLSGHTHGAQFGIEIPSLRWSPAQYIYKQWAGLYTEGEQNLYVNRGLGFIGFNGRIGIRPEISLIELKCAQNA